MDTYLSHISHIEPSRQFQLAIRGGFVSIGSSLNAWCISRGYHQQNVGRALNGNWRGPRATEICMEVRLYLEENGVSI